MLRALFRAPAYFRNSTLNVPRRGGAPSQVGSVVVSPQLVRQICEEEINEAGFVLARPV